MSIVVISFAEPARLRRYQRVHNWPFTLLADPQREAYTHFGFKLLPWRRVLSWGAVKAYARLLWRGKHIEFYGRDDYFQSGGDLLINREGKLYFSHHSRDPADRPGVRRLLEKVRKATRHQHRRG